MTIIGIAHVPGITTLAREDTLRLPGPVEQHPTWCVGFGSTTPMCGGDHLGKAIDIPATAGDFYINDFSAVFPRIEVAATTNNGASAVMVALFDPAGSEWAELHLKPATARELAASLETGRATRESGINRSLVWLAVHADEPATVTVIDPDRAVLVSARLHTHEVKALAAAITGAADLVQQTGTDR